MKKFLAILTMSFVFAVTVPVSVSAYSGGNKYKKSYNGKRYKKKQHRSYNRYQRQSNRRYYSNNGRYNRNYYNNGRYDNSRYYGRDRRSVYSRHRNLINVGIGGAAGAIVGGKRGALIGAGVGAGAGAAYTYGINPKKKRSRYSRRRY